MAQLTKQNIQDIADTVEEVLDRKLEEKLETKLDQKLEDKLDKKLDQKLDQKLEEQLDSKLGAFMEHIDNKFAALAEAISLMNTNMQGLAKQSDLQIVKDDVATIKFAVKETNKDLRSLEGRFGGLEDRFDRFERAFI